MSDGSGTRAPPRPRLESDNLFRALFQNADMGIVVTDRDGVWTDVNPAMCELLGFRREELIGLPGAELVPADAIERRAQARDELSRTGHWRGELPLLCTDGRHRVLDWQVTVLPENGLRLGIATDTSGRRRGEAELREMNEALLVSSVRQHELTERAGHAEQAARLSERSTRAARDYAQSILRVSPVPLLVLNSALRVSTANEAFYRTFNVAPAETEGSLVYELGNGQWSVPRLRELLDDVVTRDVSFEQFEVTHDFDSIGRRTMQLNARRTTAEEGGPPRIVLVIEDITERKQALELVQEHSRLLELIARGAPLARSLEELCQAVERIDRSVHACVLRANAERTYFTDVTAPSFPGFAEAIATVPIGDGSIGTCARALVSDEAVVCDDIEHDAGWADEWKALCLGYGIRAGYSSPVLEAEALPRASVFLCFDRSKVPTDGDRRLAAMATGVVGVALQRHWREAERRAELADAQLLQRLSAEIVYQDAVEDLYQKILDAAVAVMRADFASLQMFDPERGAGGELRLLGSRGFDAQAVEFWERVRADSECTCGVALRTRKRSIVPDVEQCDFMAGTDDLAMHRRTGMRGVQSTPLLSRSGELVGMISTHWRNAHQPTARNLRLLDIVARQAADLIERTRAEQERQKLVALVEQCDELIVMATLDGELTYVNPSGSRLVGLDHLDGDRSISITDYLSGESQRLFDETIVPTLMTSGHWVGEVQGKHRRTGQLIPMLQNAFLILQPGTGEPLLMAAVARDISERKQAEQALRDADRRKDEFLATLAHELRNPLAPIRTGLDVMKRVGNDPALTAEIRAMMERQISQLVRLIDDLMDVSRITRGRFHLQTQRLDLADVVQTAVEATRPFIDKAGHHLSVALPARPIFVHGDPHRLAQVLANLLNNATKYSPQPGPILLSARHDGRDAVVSVKDAGIGIPPEKLSEVFEMYSQIDRPPDSGNVGLGIGLTLVKSLVELHGGTVEVRSEGTNLGSEFIVRLALAPEQAIAPADSSTLSSPASAASNRRVLVVDDNEDAARTLSMACRILGNDVRVAHSGGEAVAVAAEFRPEVVLMDIGMPGMDGNEAARQIRARDWGRTMRLVAVTGWGQDQAKRRTREAGFDRHLVKPVEAAALQAVLADP